MLNKILLACCNSNGKLLARLKVTVAYVSEGDFFVRGYSLDSDLGALEVIEGDIQVTSIQEIPGLGFGVFQSSLGLTVTLKNETTKSSVNAIYDTSEGANMFYRPTLFEGIENGQECVISVYA